MFIVVFLKTTHLFDEDSGAFPLRSITNEASGDLFIRGESFFNINLMSGIVIYFFCVIPVVESLGYLVSPGFNIEEILHCFPKLLSTLPSHNCT